MVDLLATKPKIDQSRDNDDQVNRIKNHHHTGRPKKKSSP